MPHEIDANFISSLGRLIDNHGKNYGDFQIFREMFLDYFPRFDELSSNNKKKINRRLYKFFETLFGKFWKEQNQDSLNESDSDKLTYSNQYADLFFEYCLKNINKITEKLISEAYYEFMINDLNVVITIDDLINSNGQRTIGEYDDETLTLRIVLFDYFKKFYNQMAT